MQVGIGQVFQSVLDVDSIHEETPAREVLL